MEVVLTRLRDFSCKEACFDDCRSAGMLQDDQPAAERKSPDHTARLDIESALAWLRRELMELRSQDQLLIRQLMELHAGIQELKQECAVEEEEDEEEAEYEEDRCWDSGSEAGASSSSSYSGEMSFYPSSYVPFRTSPNPVGLLHKRAFSRRSSVP